MRGSTPMPAFCNSPARPECMPASYGGTGQCNPPFVYIVPSCCSPSPPPPSPPPPAPPPPNPPAPSTPPRECKWCYAIKWNNHQQERPVFAVDQVPHDHPLVTSNLNNNNNNLNTGTLQCSQIATTMTWFWWDFNTLSANQFLTATGRQQISMPGANAFYAYSYPYSWSANTGRETSNTVNLFFLQDAASKFFHFYIIDKAWDGSGGDYRMTLSGTHSVFAPGGTTFHDAYTPAHPAIAAATAYPGVHVAGTLPIMLRDDPWNVYNYDASTGSYQFHWIWLECCTDGMVLGPMPCPSSDSDPGFNITYEADCANMAGLEQGTRISMWNPLGPAYNPGGCDGAPLKHPVSGVLRAANWIHYDVPMDQTCTWTAGIQLTAKPCAAYCARFTNCGECSSTPECGWDASASSSSDACKHINEFGGPLTKYGETCSVCETKTTAFDCMCEPGCGWAPLDNKTAAGPVGFCISGMPDYPSNQTVTVVQWETKGCPADCVASVTPGSQCSTYPSTCCPSNGAKSQCYRAAYNEKSAFASIRLMDEYGVMPATNYPAHHPKVALGVAGGTTSSALPACDLWSRSGSTASSGPSIYSTNGSVAFFAYSYPAPYSSNTNFEAEDSMVTFLVQGDDCKTYLLVLVDKAGSSDGTGGTLQLRLTTSGVSGSPIQFLNDPQGAVDASAYDGYSPQTGVVSWAWEACCNDGMVVGPMPYGYDWSVHLEVMTRETRGLDTFKIGTYDAARNDVGFVTANIRKATRSWGGLQYDGMECTSWCQRYTDCAACFRDEQCQFSAAHGGCIAADAYIYDFGCPRPALGLITRVMQRGGDAFERESRADGFDSRMVMRFGLPAGLDMSCPCAQRYRICVTIYSAAMEPVYRAECVAPRLDYHYTFIDFGAPLIDNTLYHAYSYLCVQQGTLGRDDCSPVQIDTFTLQLAPPPPSPPPPM